MVMFVSPLSAAIEDGETEEMEMVGGAVTLRLAVLDVSAEPVQETLAGNCT